MDWLTAEESGEWFGTEMSPVLELGLAANNFDICIFDHFFYICTKYIGSLIKGNALFNIHNW